MRTEGRRTSVAPIILSAAAFLWPAVWNGYPLVFADTGTYLSQAIEHYVGWDRPVFYSLFLLPLHLTLTTWPAIAVQALLAAYVLHLVRRTLLPSVSPWWLTAGAAVIALATVLPWFASRLEPDVFAGLLVLVQSLLLLTPERLSRTERLGLVLFAAFMIAAHQSHLPLAIGLVLVMLPLRDWLGALRPLTWDGVIAVLAPAGLAAAALIAVNIAAFGRVSVSPFGNVFLLARVVYDGPGLDALNRRCPAAGWRLCAQIERFPATTDDFLWRADGPVAAVDGAKQLSGEAGAIITAALRAEPRTELLAMLSNAAVQLVRFGSGDGLQAWSGTVTPVIVRDFPAFEYRTYEESRQTRDALAVPQPLARLQVLVAVIGVVACCAVLGVALRSRRVEAGFALAALLAVLGNAAITGALSGPHDRYQSRIMWLPPTVAVLTATALLRDRRL